MRVHESITLPNVSIHRSLLRFPTRAWYSPGKLAIEGGDLLTKLQLTLHRMVRCFVMDPLRVFRIQAQQ